MSVRRRMRHHQQRPDAARFLADHMVEDVLDRLAFLRFEPARALVIGDWTHGLASALEAGGARVEAADPIPDSGETAIDEEQPYRAGDFHLVVSLGLLDTVNDLPGALIHMRRALAPGGLAIASFTGAGSLPALRCALLAADADRPAARLHPMIDIRAGAELIQRAGWADPVVDSQSLKVSYGALPRLVADLREQGLGQVLASRPPPLDRAAYQRARQAFAAQAEAGGRVIERFEIVTLSGRRR